MYDERLAIIFDNVSYNDRAVMIAQLREIFNDPEADDLGPELATHMYKIGVFNRWEYEFAIGTAAQKMALTSKQMYWRLKTHMKILDEFDIVDVEHSMKLLLAYKRMKGSRSASDAAGGSPD